MILQEVCSYVADKIDNSALNKDNYISTENMMQNCGGITSASNVPVGKSTRFIEGDVLFSNIRPYFKKLWRANTSGGCSADVLCIRANEKINPTYLYYLLTQDSFISYVMAGTKGCKMPRGDKQYNMAWNINLPSLDVQGKISAQLLEIDSKITINRRICENLEAQAQALFKHWFIDFAPFKDGKFVETELGRIPEGWRVGKLGEICTYSTKKIAISQLTKKSYYSTENMLPNKAGADEASSLPQAEMTTGCLPYDVLVSNIRPYFKKIVRVATTCGCSTDVLCFHPVDSKYISYMYRVLYDDSFFTYVMLGSKGTKMPRGDKKQIMKYPIVIPVNFVLEDFSNLVEPMFELITSLKKRESPSFHSS